MKENKMRCDIPNCGKIASRGSIFCIDHSDPIIKAPVELNVCAKYDKLTEEGILMIELMRKYKAKYIKLNHLSAHIFAVDQNHYGLDKNNKIITNYQFFNFGTGLLKRTWKEITPSEMNEKLKELIANQ